MNDKLEIGLNSPIKLVIQMPALNEAKTIGQVLDSIPGKIDGIDKVQVVVVNDGSSDDTGAIALEHGAHVVAHDRPRGVGFAFRSGLNRSIELFPDIILTIDADGQFDPNDIPALIAPIIKGEADFVTASRFHDPAMEPDMPRAKRWGNKVIANWLSRMIGREFHDVSCGFRAYSRKAFLRLNPQGDFTYTHEVFLSLAFAGLRIIEVPVRVRGVREHGRSRVAGNLFKYAWQAAAIIFATYRDYRPLAFFGSISGVLGIPGFLCLCFLGAHWFRTGALSPYKAVGFIGGALCGAALLVYLIGLMAAMLSRLRSGVETAMVRSGEFDYRLQSATQESKVGSLDN